MDTPNVAAVHTGVPDAASTASSRARPPWASAAALIDTVKGVLLELRAGEAGVPPVALDSNLDRELGFDSLARMELLLRIERALGMDLSADTWHESTC